MISAGIESFEKGLPELSLLTPRHYEELSQHKDRSIPLDPLYPLYIARERAGELLYVTLRENGSLIGYFIGFIAPGMHYSSCLTLTMDIVYVVPERRGNGGGLVLGQTIEREAKRRGVRAWLMGYKEEHADFMHRMLVALGFKPFERTMVKWLGD